MLIVAVLLGLVVLRWGLLLAGAVLVVPRVDDCPACFSETIRVRRRWLRALLPRLEWRWCPTCGWEGPSSREGSELVPAASARLRARRSGEAPGGRRSSGEDPFPGR